MAYVNGFLDELKNISDGIRVLADEPMDGHTTFKVGGPADYFVVPDSVQSVVDVIRLCKKTGTPCFVIGRGSNGAAGEIGHLTVNYDEEETCGCGKKGCLEQFASATGIVKEANRLLLKTDKPSKLLD